ncbi:GNAT family N-acetyltransferase [Nocardia callitridis]|uniref:GNAT family N-acetyltransferase n=1 Tax=Nocardia callitridis TaxID=648753 RepID=A0ABP9KUK2_9NOCA
MDAHPMSNGTVWLSLPTLDDVDAITECCRQPSVAEWVTVPSPYHREDATGFIADIVGPGWAARSPTWALREHAEGPVVGMVTLEATDASAAEIGFWLDARKRRRGLMAQAVHMVCDFGFRTDGLDLDRISWRAFVGNHASAALARRAGFRFEGTARLGSLQRGVRRDHWFAGRLRTDPSAPAPDWPAECFG